MYIFGPNILRKIENSHKFKVMIKLCLGFFFDFFFKFKFRLKFKITFEENSAGHSFFNALDLCIFANICCKFGPKMDVLPKLS